MEYTSNESTSIFTRLCTWALFSLSSCCWSRRLSRFSCSFSTSFTQFDFLRAVKKKKKQSSTNFFHNVHVEFWKKGLLCHSRTKPKRSTCPIFPLRASKCSQANSHQAQLQERYSSTEDNVTRRLRHRSSCCHCFSNKSFCLTFKLRSLPMLLRLPQLSYPFNIVQIKWRDCLKPNRIV